MSTPTGHSVVTRLDGPGQFNDCIPQVVSSELDPSQVASGSAVKAAPLGHGTARGMAWMAGQTIAAKVAATLGQIALAWLLGPGDWGMVGLAYTVFALATLVQFAGVREILIYRHARFERWANAAFWLSLGVGVLAALLTVAGAPIAARIYDNPQVMGLTLVLALAPLFAAPSTVPQSQLQAEMRFRSLALVQLGAAVGTVGLSILFAALKFGAYSFVLPRPIIALAQSAILCWWVPPPVRLNLQLRRWWFLAGSTGWLIASSVCVTVLAQADRFALGLFSDELTVGQYFFAFNLSTQTMQLISFSLAGAMLPALSKLQNEPVRLREAFNRASRMVALLAMPLCLLQAAVAFPVCRLMFPARWEPAIPLLVVLSIGMAVYSPTVTIQAMLQAQGKYRRLFYILLISAATFLAAVLVGAWLGADHNPGLWVAVAATVHTILCWPVNLYLTIRPVGGTWGHVSEILVKPAFASTLAVGAPWLLGQLVPHVAHSDILLLLSISGLSLLLYTWLIKWLAPRDWRDLLDRLRALTGRATPVAADAA